MTPTEDRRVDEENGVKRVLFDKEEGFEETL